MRRHLSFACEGQSLVGTVDEADGAVGLLWVGGGNEIRSGAFAGQAQLAARIAAAGYPVFRFDRRGVGDSEGENRGFENSAADLAAAFAAFRAQAPAIKRVIAFGNCDAASTLMLQGGAGCDALVLANPWTIEDGDESPTSDAIRSRYANKLRDPGEWLRFVKGQVSLGKLGRGLVHAMRPARKPTSLAQSMAAGLAPFSGPVHILIAERDRTGQAFLGGWNRADPRLTHCPAASHAFAEPAARAWLEAQLLAALAQEQARQLDVG